VQSAKRLFALPRRHGLLEPHAYGRTRDKTQTELRRVTTRRVRHAEHPRQREQRWARGPGYVDNRLQLRIDLRREAEVVGEREAGEAAEEVGVQGLAADVQPGQGSQRVRPACSLAAWRTAAPCSQCACYCAARPWPAYPLACRALGLPGKASCRAACSGSSAKKSMQQAVLAYKHKRPHPNTPNCIVSRAPRPVVCRSSAS